MRNSRSSLFLMELVVVILFFSLSSAVCVRLFVKAHQIDQSTVNMNHAMLWIQNYAEEFRSNPVEVNETVYFDKEWNACEGSSSALYSVSIHSLPDVSAIHGHVAQAEITVNCLNNKQASVLASQTIQRYVPVSDEKEAENE